MLRRKYAVPLAKKNEATTKLRGRHFCYILEENTDYTKQPDMEVILTEYVAGLGKKGEVVKVRPNIAYYQLLMLGRAAYATPANIEKYSKMAQETEAEDLHSSKYAQKVIQ